MSQEKVFKKAAFAAVGMPVRFGESAMRRFDRVADRIAGWRDNLVEGARTMVRESIREGEQVIDSVTTRAREGAATSRETSRSLLVVATEPIVPVATVDGVGPTYADRLTAAGVASTRALVERCRSEQAIARLGSQADIPAALIAEWVESADLTRIDGVGPEHIGLLNAAGVGTIQQMAQIDTAGLHDKVNEVNSERRLVARVPGELTLAKWKSDAASLAG